MSDGLGFQSGEKALQERNLMMDEHERLSILRDDFFAYIWCLLVRCSFYANYDSFWCLAQGRVFFAFPATHA
jgi:hypothetical protein